MRRKGYLSRGLGDAGKLTVHMDSIEAAIVSGSAASLFECRYPLHQENPWQDTQQRTRDAFFYTTMRAILYWVMRLLATAYPKHSCA